MMPSAFLSDLEMENKIFEGMFKRLFKKKSRFDDVFGINIVMYSYVTVKINLKLNVSHPKIFGKTEMRPETSARGTRWS